MISFPGASWDDFRLWVFAESDVCFVRLVYLVGRAGEPGPRRKPHVYALCVSGHCLVPTPRLRVCPCFCFLRLLRNLPLPGVAPIWLPSFPPPIFFLCSSTVSRVAGLEIRPLLSLVPLCGPFCSAHRGDLPSAAVLPSRLTTRLSLTTSRSWAGLRSGQVEPCVR